MTRISFVNIVEGATHSYSHGVAALAGELLRAGWSEDDVRVVTVHEAATALGPVLANDPSLILMSVMSNQWKRARVLADQIKAANPAIAIGIGGVHVTAAKHTVEEHPAFDFGFAGEADLVIAERIGQWTQKRKLRLLGSKVESGESPANLDDLAMPAVHLFDVGDVRLYPSVMFSRGCPYKCNYCMSRNGGETGKVRWKSVERAIEECKSLVAYADPEILYFDDDTLLKNPKWVRQFMTIYSKAIGRPFYCNARPETVTDDLAALLVASGCAALGIGIESGSERIRREILNRPMTDERIERAFNSARTAGLKTWSFNMVGLPSESTSDVASLIDLNNRCQPDFVRLSIFTPYPGTPMGRDVDASDEHLSYFRPWTDLPVESVSLVSTWLGELQSHNRLWYTDSELMDLLEHR